MNYWLIKSEPSTYSWDQFFADKETAWDGVRNYAARLHLKAMKKGDKVFFYHSNEGMEIVGTAMVSKEFYPDASSDVEGWVSVNFVPVKKMKKPVSLAQIKANKKLADMALIRLSRLSVQPVNKNEWDEVMKMAGEIREKKSGN